MSAQAPSSIHQQHRRTHNLLLISKLLNQRDAIASPFTLVLDSLEQRALTFTRSPSYLGTRLAETSIHKEDNAKNQSRKASSLIGEYIRRALLSKSHTIFLSFETTVKPSGIETFIPCYNKTAPQIAQAVSAAIANNPNRRNLILIDSLHPLCTLSLDARSNLNLTAYLSSFLAPPSPTTSSSIVAIYHTDIPLPVPQAQLSYQPSPLSLLTYLATTILRLHSLSVHLAAKEARERSQVPPSFGLAEEKQGILIGLKPIKTSKGTVLKPEEQGLILELEHRRKSGRGVREWYFLPSKLPSTPALKETVTLLDDHPLFKKSIGDDQMSDQELAGMTFELGLTDRQKLERDGVVLPYFDAQKGAGPGKGGRILYDMGSEDDFDEEEDEI